MGTMASQITSLTSVYSTVYSDADRRKHQSSASLTSVGEIRRGPVNPPNKWPVARKKVSIGWRHHGYTWFCPKLLDCSRFPNKFCLTRRYFSRCLTKYGNRQYLVAPFCLMTRLISRLVSMLISWKLVLFPSDHCLIHMGQVTKVGLSCYLVLLSVDSKIR